MADVQQLQCNSRKYGCSGGLLRKRLDAQPFLKGHGKSITMDA